MRDKSKKMPQLKKVYNGDTACTCISHNSNSKNRKCAVSVAANRLNVNMFLNNSTFLIFAILVV